MQPGFSILEHPSDLGIEARGRTLEEAFEQAALGLMSIILDLSTAAEEHSKIISVTGVDREQLLVKWLSEILYLYDGEKFIGKRFSTTRLDEHCLESNIFGEYFSETKHKTKLDVKAITYHQLGIMKEKDGWRVRVFLDI